MEDQVMSYSNAQKYQTPTTTLPSDHVSASFFGSAITFAGKGYGGLKSLPVHFPSTGHAG